MRRAELRRSLGLWQLTVSGVGIIIGAGVYVLIGEAAALAGSMLWAAFIIGAVLAALTGLSYAELASLFPSAGAEYDYARNAFNEFAGFVAGWMMAGANIVGAAAVSIGFAHYLRYFVEIDTRVAALGLLIVLTGVVIIGVSRSIWLSVVLVVLQVGGLLTVIAAGAPEIGNRSLVEGASAGGVLSAAALVFFAFIGFDEVATLSEETSDPQRTVPRALILGVVISVALYVAVGIAAVSAVGPAALAASDTPLSLVIETRLGIQAGGMIAIVAIASTTNTTLLLLTTSTRLLFGMSRSGALPATLARVSRRTGAPWIAATAVLAAAVPFALSGAITIVAEVTNFAIYVIFVAVNASLIRLRFTRPNAARAFRVPASVGGIPATAALGLASAVLMMAYLSVTAWVLGGLMVLSALLAWLIGPLVGRRPAPREPAQYVPDGRS